MSATSDFAYGPPPPGGFYAYRPIVVPTDLDALCGPLEGVVRLPSHIDTSSRAWYDLADGWDREMLYRIVILEAWRDEDFGAWLNRAAPSACRWTRRAWPRGLARNWRGGFKPRFPVVPPGRDVSGVRIGRLRWPRWSSTSPTGSRDVTASHAAHGTGRLAASA